MAQSIQSDDRFLIEIYGRSTVTNKTITLYFNDSKIGQDTTTLNSGIQGATGATGPMDPVGADGDNLMSYIENIDTMGASSNTKTTGTLTINYKNTTSGYVTETNNGNASGTPNQIPLPTNVLLVYNYDGNTTTGSTVISLVNNPTNPNQRVLVPLTKSDKRIKTNLTMPHNIDHINKMRNINVYNYNYKFNSTGQLHTGFISQEIESTIPEAIQIGNDFIPNFYITIQPTINNNGSAIFNFSTLTCDTTVSVSDNNIVKFILPDRSVDLKIMNVIKTYNNDVITNIEFTVFDLMDLTDGYNASVLIYGKFVNDYHYISKDKIFAIGIGAIKYIDGVLSTANTNIGNLQTKLTTANTNIQTLKNVIINMCTQLNISELATPLQSII